MISKYILDETLYISDLRHDMNGLMGPLECATDLFNKNEVEKAVRIQQDVIKKLKFIIDEIQRLPDSALVKSED